LSFSLRRRSDARIRINGLLRVVGTPAEGKSMLRFSGRKSGNAL
jgi:hypothetical protein